MQVFTKTISTVFGREGRYVIPLFQRPYVWSETYQWSPLWEDIVEQAERQLASPNATIPPHFLGAVVVQQAASYGDQLLAHHVIDGQQRLTTFQVLLAALRDVAKTVGDGPTMNFANALTRNQNAIENAEVEQFKLWPTSRDVAQFRLVSSAGSKEEVERHHPPIWKRKRLQTRPRLVEAYVFFHDAILQWVQSEGEAAHVTRCRALRRVLDKQLQLVSIELDGPENPQVIFETLNARGVPLLASDLLRNFIFQRAGSPEAAEQLHRAYWHRFEKADSSDDPDGLRFWEVEVRQGRLSRARLDLFVQHYLTMKKRDEVLSSRLYHDYKEWIERERPFESVEKELIEFTRFADIFEQLLRPDHRTPLGQFAAHLQVLDTLSIYPLVLALAGNAALPDAERLAIFRDLESFLVRRAICGRTTKNYTRLFISLLQNFEKNGDWTRAAFRALLAAGKGDGVDWPDDDAFSRAWLEIDAYRELKPARVQMILRAIEAALRTAKSEKISIESELSVEHVMPQEWKAHWPLPAGEDVEAATQRREELVQDFGNLTLLTTTLNPSVSNGPAEKKLKEITEHSTLRLNAYFQRRTTWNEDDILERGKVLLETAKKVWPGP